MEAMEMIGALKQQEWGKHGPDSFAGMFYWHSTRRNLMKDDQAYSSVAFSGNIARKTILKKSYMPLSRFIRDQPQVLGKACAKLFNNKLPFEVKILSVEKSTSLFCYPNKEHAERLHNLYPARYRDTEPKPKIMLAIKYLEVLAGFRRRDEISWFLNALPELAICAPYAMIENFLCKGKERHLREIFHYCINASQSEVKLAAEILFKRLEKADNGTKTALLFNVVQKLYAQHSNDAGIFSPYFLNHIILKPGQALYIPPGVPHCYIMGDSLEVTTCSQTILRSGLTPKYTDKHEFLKIVDFRPYSPEMLLLEPTVVDSMLSTYYPPVPQFCINQIKVPKEITYTLPVTESCSILLVTRGEGTLKDHRRIALGTAVLVLPYEKVTVYCDKRNLTIYSVYVNLGFLSKTYENVI